MGITSAWAILIMGRLFVAVDPDEELGRVFPGTLHKGQPTLSEAHRIHTCHFTRRRKCCGMSRNFTRTRSPACLMWASTMNPWTASVAPHGATTICCSTLTFPSSPRHVTMPTRASRARSIAARWKASRSNTPQARRFHASDGHRVHAPASAGRCEEHHAEPFHRECHRGGLLVAPNYPTVLGNILTQAIALGRIKDLNEADLIYQQRLKRPPVPPNPTTTWAPAHDMLCKIRGMSEAVPVSA